MVLDYRKQGRCAKQKLSEIRSPRAEKPLEAGASRSGRGSVAGAAFHASGARLCSSMQPAVLDHSKMTNGGVNITVLHITFLHGALPPIGEAASRREKARRS